MANGTAHSLVSMWTPGVTASSEKNHISVQAIASSGAPDDWAARNGSPFATLSVVGCLPAAPGRKIHFTGTTVLRLKDGKIVEEIGPDDGVKALTQPGLIKTAA